MTLSEETGNDHMTQPFLGGGLTPRTIPFIIFLAAFTFCLNANTLFNGFVYDDHSQIENNRWITDSGYLPEIFSSSEWRFMGETAGDNYYRPLSHAIRMIVYHGTGPEPWAFHLVNILFHIGVTIMVYIVMSALVFKNHQPGLLIGLTAPQLAALLFAAHPIHTEAVAWIAGGMTEMPYTFFALTSLFFHVRSKETFDSSRMLSLAAFAISLLFKETAALLLPLLLVYDYIYRGGGRELFKRFPIYAAYLLISGAYLAIRIHALGGFAPAVPPIAHKASYYLLNVFPLFARYVRKLVFPVNLSISDYFPPVQSMLESRAILGLGLALLYGVAIIVSARRSKPVFFALILILLPLLPVFYFPGIGEIKFGERYLYFPSVGLTILLASLIGWGTARLPRTGNIALTAFAAILTATYAFATVSRNADWKDDSTLFRDAQAKLGFSQSGEEQKSSGASPGSSFLVLDQAEIENNFGNISYNDGKYDKAIEHYTKAVSIQPDYAEALYNIGSVYYDMKQYDKTIDYCQKAINSRPEYAEAYSLMGMASSNIGRADDAMKYLQAALRIDPDNAESHYNLAIVYGNKGLTKDAVQELKYALRIRPDFAEAKNALSQLVSARK